jgi:hypothetical protein
LKALIVLLAILLSSGCSTVSKTINYEIEPSPQFKRTYASDWCEEDQAALGVVGDHCFGIYKPPLYSYPVENGFIVIYPILISHGEIAAGPLGLPIVPLGGNNPEDGLGQKLYFRFRTYSESALFEVYPSELTVSHAPKEVCKVVETERDKIGSIFTCVHLRPTSGSQNLIVKLKLSDNSDFEIQYKLSVFTSYRPVVAPNGPARRVEPFIIIESTDAIQEN